MLCQLQSLAADPMGCAEGLKGAPVRRSGNLDSSFPQGVNRLRVRFRENPRLLDRSFMRGRRHLVCAVLGLCLSPGQDHVAGDNDAARRIDG